MVCLESDFQDRLPREGEAARIGLVDPDTGAFNELSETRAWNLSQGSMIHWSPLAPNREIIYNDRADREIRAIRLDVTSGKRTMLPLPVSGVAPRGRHALCLTWGRLSRLRTGYGYSGASDPNPKTPHPANDGVFLMDLEKSESELVVSMQQVYEYAAKDFPELKERHMWFNHTVFSPDGQRFFFLARTRDEEGEIDSAMFVSDLDGGNLKMLVPFGSGISHFAWRGNAEIAATYYGDDATEMRHFLIPIKGGEASVIGKGFIRENGHMSFTEDGRYMVTDRKETDRLSQSLWLYDMERDQGMQMIAHPMGNFRNLHGNTRSDFHPRWSPSGKSICYDAIDTRDWTRQLHLVEFI